MEPRSTRTVTSAKNRNKNPLDKNAQLYFTITDSIPTTQAGKVLLAYNTTKESKGESRAANIIFKS